MKYLFVFLITVSFLSNCEAQARKERPLPAAKKLNDSAISIFTKTKGSPDQIPRITALLNAALKLDSNYYQGWVNKLNFECHYDKFDKGLKTAERMRHLFPKEPDVYFYCGILQYKNKHDKDALVSFNKLLKIYNTDLADKSKSKYYKAIEINKGIALILLDRPAEGKTLLHKLYDQESDDMLKSYLGFYINASKQELIDDKVPGK